MTDAETSVVEQTLRIDARPETVWRYWTDPIRMCEWWGAAAELDPRPGGACVVEMDGSGVMRGEYVEVVPLLPHLASAASRINRSGESTA